MIEFLLGVQLVGFGRCEWQFFSQIEIFSFAIFGIDIEPQGRNTESQERNTEPNRLNFGFFYFLISQIDQRKRKTPNHVFHFFSKQTTQKSNQIKQTTQTLTQKNIPMRELMKHFKKKVEIQKQEQGRHGAVVRSGMIERRRTKIEAWKLEKKRKE